VSFLPLLLLPMALAPFALGAFLAAASGFPVSGFGLTAGLLAVAALTLSGLTAREAFAPEVNCLPHLQGLNRDGWQRLAHRCLILAGVLALLLQWLGKTGDLTIPLAVTGVLGGYFIFAPPVAWHRRGLGEFWGGLSFGLLPVLAGFYLQSRQTAGAVWLCGLPLSLAAFNLFLLLGWPAPGAEAAAVPSTLASRLGPLPAALAFTVANVLMILCLAANFFVPVGATPALPWLWAPVVLALVIQEMMKRRAYLRAARLRLVCFLTLALHLGICLVFSLGLRGRL
jgi:1,4-dihydroxy-2-naphthoate octaprenyltransferase